MGLSESAGHYCCSKGEDRLVFTWDLNPVKPLTNVRWGAEGGLSNVNVPSEVEIFGIKAFWIRELI